MSAVRKSISTTGEWYIGHSVPIVLGLHRTSDSYRTAYFNAGIQVAPHAEDMLDAINLAQVPQSFIVRFLRVGEFGRSCESACLYPTLIKKTQKWGYNLYTPEVAAMLRLAEPTIPVRGRSIPILTEPVRNENGHSKIFELCYTANGPLLECSEMHNERVFSGDQIVGLVRAVQSAR